MHLSCVLCFSMSMLCQLACIQHNLVIRRLRHHSANAAPLHATTGLLHGLSSCVVQLMRIARVGYNMSNSQCTDSALPSPALPLASTHVLLDQQRVPSKNSGIRRRCIPGVRQSCSWTCGLADMASCHPQCSPGTVLCLQHHSRRQPAPEGPPLVQQMHVVHKRAAVAGAAGAAVFAAVPGYVVQYQLMPHASLHLHRLQQCVRSQGLNDRRSCTD